MEEPNRCAICQAPCDVVEVTAKFTGIKKKVCPRCYLKLRDTGLIEKAANRELLELKRKQFEKAKAEFDITNMCICASIIEKLENEIKESE